MTMGFGRMFMSLGRVLVTLVVFALPMMLRCGSMGLSGVLVMFGRSRMGFLWHFSLSLMESARFRANVL
jgi:hypothetical protein